MTLISIERGPSYMYRVNSFTYLDNQGKKLSVKTYWQLNGEPELRLYQSEDYVYKYDGGYHVIFTQHNRDQEHVSIIEFHPGFLSTERWTWEGSDQVLIRTTVGL